MANAVAFVDGRNYIVPRDVQNVFVSTLNHRIILSDEATLQNLGAEKILTDILYKVKQPKI